MPVLPVHHQLPEFAQTHVHWVGDAIQPSHPLSSPSPPAPNPSQHQGHQGLFQWGNSSHEVAEVLEFQLQHQSFSEYSDLISFRMDWLDGRSPWASLRDAQESSPTPQLESINSFALSFLYSPALMSIHYYWKTIALTRWAFVGKVMSLLFNILSKSVITFLPRSKRLLNSWLQSPYAVILEPQK